MRSFLTLTSLFLLLTNCSNKISPFFEYNRYTPDFNYHIVNDSLQAYHRSLGDFRYITSKTALKKQLRGQPLDHVLVYGKTVLDPFYEYYLLYNSRQDLKLFKSFPFIKDTIIQNQRFTFLGRGLNDRFPESDFEAISGSLTVGPTYRKDFVSLNSLLVRNNQANTYLKSLSEISDYPALDQSEEGAKLQFQLTFASFMGKNPVYEQLLQQWAGNFRADEAVKKTILEKGEQGQDEVLQQILSLTREQALVMFNENHFYPNHRKLLTLLLPELKKQGFTNLALEALGAQMDSLLNTGAMPDLKTGFYTKEPQFNELIRTAQQLGFRFIAYENTDDSKSREQGQADNLYAQSFARDPKARVIVYAGISHITEKTVGDGRKWMAQLFKEKYGIDPLTFSQTHLNNYAGEIKTLLALLPSGMVEGDYYQTVDLHIVNNLDWRDAPGNFTYQNNYPEPVQIAIFDNTSFRTERSYFDNVPEKSFLLEPGEKYSTNLIHNNYRLIVFDKEGKALENRLIPGTN